MFRKKPSYNNLSVYIFNYTVEAVRGTIKIDSSGATNDQVVRIFDAYYCGCLFFLTLSMLEKYDDKGLAMAEVIQKEMAELVKKIEAEYRTKSNFSSQYEDLRDQWFDDDPLHNPISYTSELINEEFKASSLDVVLDIYSLFREKVDEDLSAQ